MSLKLKQQRTLFAECLKHLDNIDHDDGCYSWWVRDVNSDKNNEWFLSNYAYLRTQFTLPQMSRKPSKMTSQTLSHMSKQCQYTFCKKIRCYMIEQTDGKRKKSTSAFAEVKIAN